nr:uncharacterized mitochondrial protein AtMg00810-like [Tanacetum cinerariifolium]
SAPASDHLNQKWTIESRAKRSSKIISLGQYSIFACFFTHCENEDGNLARANIKQALGRFILGAYRDTTLIILMVAAAASLALGIKTEKLMMTDSDMTDLGTMRYFLGIEVKQRTHFIFIGQCKYAQEMLEKFNMDQCNSVHNPAVLGLNLTKDEEGTKVDGTIYRQMVGGLMYLTTKCPDLMFIKWLDGVIACCVTIRSYWVNIIYSIDEEIGVFNWSNIQNRTINQGDLVVKYLKLYEKYHVPWRMIRSHVHKMLGKWFRVYPHIRDDLNKQSKLSFELMYDMVDRLWDLRVTTPLYEGRSFKTVQTSKDEEQVHYAES